MKKLIAILMLLVGVWLHCGSAGAQSSRYALVTRAVKGDEYSKDGRGDEYSKIVSLRDKKLNRIVWTRKISNGRRTWSMDKRAVAIEGISHILVWREGYQLRDFAVPGARDYLMGCVWSPDKHRLLIRCGSSGSADVDVGSLFCLKLGGGKSYNYSPVAVGVRDMKWRDNRTVLYWLLDDQTGRTSTKPRIWRAP